MDIKFIENILKKYENDETICLKSIKNEKVENFMSILIKITVNGLKGRNIDDYQFRFIVKSLQNDEDKKRIFLTKEAFQNELFAYNHILPELDQYSVRLISRPKCIYTNDKMIFLEDLYADGYTNVDKLTGFNDVHKIKLILKEIANLHSASMVMKSKNSHEFNKINGVVEELIYSSNKEPLMGNLQEEIIPLAIGLIKKDNNSQEVLNILEKLNGKVRDSITNLFETSTKFCVINHGDLWGNNIMFKGDTVKLIDFQLMRYTSLAADLNYFLFINIDPDFRVNNYENFLQYYLSEFNRNIQTKGLKNDFELKYDELKSEMAQFAIFGFISAFWISPVYFCKPEDLGNEKSIKNLGVEQYIADMSSEHKKRCLLLIRDYVNILSD